ncbi:MAG: hypothetical protein JNN11_01825 [Candidatus Doudnabacteria bacterium]|nr:hypothetical protein [Candidatus Doudnabacteria bacterium]
MGKLPVRRHMLLGTFAHTALAFLAACLFVAGFLCHEDQKKADLKLEQARNVNELTSLLKKSRLRKAIGRLFMGLAFIAAGMALWQTSTGYALASASLGSIYIFAGIATYHNEEI